MKEKSLKKYDLLKKLASGGQGDVYLARQSNDDLGLDKIVAIKFIKKHTCSKDVFKNEVKLLSQLNHPNICKILDVGEEEDSYYIVMEYIEGINLKEFITISKQKGINIPGSLIYEVGKNIFEALDYAHHHSSGKVLHKDISPHNIMISKSGCVVLIDFGISELLTHENNSLKGGKPSYLPSRIITEIAKYDESVDMYSLGVVLYELVSSSRVTNENDLNLELISDQGLREIIASLVNFNNSYEVFNKPLPLEMAQVKGNILKVISTMVDEKIISEKTVISSSNNRQRKNSLKTKTMSVGVILFLLILLWFYWGLKKTNKIDFSNNIKIMKQGKVLAPDFNGFQFNNDFKETLSFSEVSCEMFCLQVITNLTMGHKDTYKQFVGKGMMPDNFKVDYEKYLNHTLLQYKKTQTSFYEMQNRCSIRETCQYASSFSRLISQYAPLNLDHQTLKREYDKAMKGVHKELNSTIEIWNKKPIVTSYISKNYPNALRLKSYPGLNYTIYKSNDDVNEENCRLIGDFEFMNRTVDLSLPFEATMNSSFHLLVFDANVEIKRSKNEISLEVGTDSKKYCSYVRENGILKNIQIWKY